MALSSLRDLPFMGEARRSADPYACRIPASKPNSSSHPLRHQRSLSSDPFVNRHDRWTADLISLRTDNRVARDLALKRSLMMPLSTGSQSVLASTTTTLPSVLEADDHGRLAYGSHNPSKTLRPVPQSNTFPSTSNSNGHVPPPRPPFAYESTTSSPSTTISTLNSAVTDLSPSSYSPHSPNSLLQTPFKQQPKLNTGLAVGASMDFHSKDDVSPVRPSTSASDSAALRKGRNMKNLSINTNGISAKQNIDSRGSTKDGLAQRPVTQSGPVPSFKPGSLPPVSESAPVSPSFIIPKMPPRRKPSKLGLTIATPDTEQKVSIPPTPSFNATFSTRQNAIPTQLQTIPQTPAFPPSQDAEREETKDAPEDILSPSMGPSGGMTFPSVTGRELRTPGLAPAGGMTLPPFASLENSPSKRSSPGADRHQPLQDHMGLHRHRSAEQVVEPSSIVNQTIEHVNKIPTYDRPLSQEVKSPSYPDGPACIYPPNVYLYHQPTANEARNFDVIINVAREVTNPFEVEAEEEKARLHAKDTQPIQLPNPIYRSVGVQVELLTEDYPPRTSSPEGTSTAATSASFGSALERLDISTDEEMPPTPRAARSQPEYLHLPWEHNSKVYEDWFDICQLIDERTKKGKRVLIHCQLGVSRSASLIVAYGIYLNPHLSPDEAREQAKQRSRWIDLNMHFMYELGDFKKLLAKKGILGAEAPRMGPGVGQAPKLAGAFNLSRSKTDTALLSPVQSIPSTPLSALSSIPGSAPLTGEGDGRDGQFARVPEGGLRTPGPSSAPTDITWSPSKRPPGTEDTEVSLVPSTTDRKKTPLAVDDSLRMLPPLDVPAGQPSPALKTPALDMPGGWATTPAMSRPTSMVLPNGSASIANANLKAAESDEKKSSDKPSDVLQDSPTEDASLLENKPTRTPSVRRLPRMPSLPSSFTSSIGSFFSLNRSSSTASKRSQSSAPSRAPSLSSRPQTQLETIPGTPVDGPLVDRTDRAGLRKPPSLPSLRTFFPLGGASTDSKPSKPGLSLTLDPIPQSAVGGDQDAAASRDEALEALMSPRAQEFVSNPFNRPVTSHVATSGQVIGQEGQRPMTGFASMISGFGQLGLRKQKSGQSLRSVNADTAKDAQANVVAGGTDGTTPELGRKASTGSHRTVIQRDTNESSLRNEDVRELMSPEAQTVDPRSPPSQGIWGSEEKVMRSIDDLI